MAEESILPLWMELQALDYNDRDFYDKLTDEQKKVFSSWIIMRYSSNIIGDNADWGLIMTNDIVNVDFSLMYKHPKLQWMLLSLCGTGRKEQRKWIAPNKKKKKNPRKEFIFKIHPNAKDDEIDMLADLYTDAELKDIMLSYGYEDKEIKDILKKK
ncbi:hypothetical protein RVBP17_1280 [Pseudomonas phage sp. 30-3]|uniref:Uncharacterized protein n=1 Tax=Pseudomonas phage vB_PaeM_PA5oct TaxID=2163605 RepID=A0A4Y1LUM6_9CAUD|nr:hypothetical protein PQE65_gp266 [Pseudomonas phage vB_PaeM_PA5oct]WMI31762.1 hypothetical protein GBBBJNDB_00059 [Pseudomonas phage Callisto]WPK38691.1 hypothetical protein Cassandra_0015 [Pseudomonas phage Cassandra]WPK39212.1 hypothetical protein Deiofobo_0015 [Pseudomonas phage Deifobo]WPK40245.1 hypothetical protein Paride_0015 [Pseudomonas phage Paride]VOH53804.1 hypothetical protein MIJ3_00059 [Pseudomonas phage vB_PaeM_MIJ3]BDR25829.1 hypothetical protein RVBP16_2690 [Pseudomonas p